MSISTSLHGVDFDYWTSATMAKGILLTIKGNFTFSGKYNMKLIDLQDGLIRRKRLQWLTEYTNCEIGTTDVWFQTISSSSTNDEEEGDETAERNLEKSFFLSVELVRYSREVAVDNSSEGLAAHFLTVRGTYTHANRIDFKVHACQ